MRALWGIGFSEKDPKEWKLSSFPLHGFSSDVIGEVPKTDYSVCQLVLPNRTTDTSKSHNRAYWR